jgi:hypothetical protein
MDDRVDVTIRVEPEVAEARESPLRRGAAGQILSGSAAVHFATAWDGAKLI